MADDTPVIMIRVSKDKIARLRKASDEHPYKPSIRSLVERGIDLVTNELNTVITNTQEITND